MFSSTKDEWNKRVIQSFLVGSFSGVCSTFLFQPLDLIKTRLQCPQQNKSANLKDVITVVIKQDKVVGLWKGLTPSLLRCVPGMGIYFGSLTGLYSFFIKDSKIATASQSVAFGAIARSFSVGSLLPLTVIKTRFESGHYKYKNVVHATKIIYSTEGIRGLYCGLSATIIRDVPYSGLYLMFYSECKRRIIPSLEITQSSFALSFVNFGCGVVSGILASVLTHPADVIKTHMQLSPNQFWRLSIAVIHIFQVDGFKGYFRGLLPRLLRRTLVTAMTWTIYEEVMKKLKIK